MTRLEMIINTVLDRLKPDLAEETGKSRRRYFKQMLRCAEVLGVTEPCTKLYDAFIADDHGSPERRELHIRCVKMVDAEACTGAKDSNGILFNEPPLPAEDEVRSFSKTTDSYWTRYPHRQPDCQDRTGNEASQPIRLHYGAISTLLARYTAVSPGCRLISLCEVPCYVFYPGHRF